MDEFLRGALEDDFASVGASDLSLDDLSLNDRKQVLDNLASEE